jgi:hypothetical protein
MAKSKVKRDNEATITIQRNGGNDKDSMRNDQIPAYIGIIISMRDDNG